jgi:hypothetical protein
MGLQIKVCTRHVALLAAGAIQEKRRLSKLFYLSFNPRWCDAAFGTGNVPAFELVQKIGSIGATAKALKIG